MTGSILCAPNGLKGVLSATDAAEWLADGIRSCGWDAVTLPVADGGEGTAAVLAETLGGEWHAAPIHDPLGRPIDGRFLMLPDRTAVVEIAAAVGWALLQPNEFDPLSASTEGVGELVLAAIAERPRRMIVCLGGSTTVDGGRGMRDVVGDALAALPVDVACDVSSPLLGPRGAAFAFGPQKGADPHTVHRLEHRLASDDALQPFAELRGAGAAGGLGAGFAALGGKLISGTQLVLDTLRFEEQLRHSSLVVTGEGAVDETSFEGKAPGVIVELGAQHDVPAVMFGGVVHARPAGVDVRQLSGDPARVVEDLVALGRELAIELLAQTAPERGGSY